jgi:hypothetical protein
MTMNWFMDLPVAITVCDTDGIIVDMNQKSAKTFEKDGGFNLLNKSMFDCHPDNANEMIKQMIQNKSTNVYTIEKAGVKKLIFQTPWFEGEKMMGLVEFSFVIPEVMPHFIRG